MKIELVNENYIRIIPCRIKKRTNIIKEPNKGLGELVLTYKVVDANGDKRFEGDDVIVGIHKNNVYSFDTTTDKSYVADKKIVVFRAYKDEDEVYEELK